MKNEYCFMMGTCINCKKHIVFNPKYVPSLRVNGKREPICRTCADYWNDIHRSSKGLPKQEIHEQAFEPLNTNEILTEER
jgi:hypothetical protein